MSKKALEYEGSFTTEVIVHIVYDDGNLCAWTDDCMEDGFDYEPYEERLKNGDIFEDVCEDIVQELSRG